MLLNKTLYHDKTKQIVEIGQYRVLIRSSKTIEVPTIFTTYARKELAEVPTLIKT